MKRSHLVLAVLAALVAAALAAGIAWATIPGGGVYTACMLKNVGTVRLIDPSLPAGNLMSHCTSLETQVSWNQQGQPGPAGGPGPAGSPGPAGANGKDGLSVTSAAEPPGANCADGGSQFTSASGTTYACNGKDGKDGADGTNGADGKDGVSVSSSSLASGDANCPNGGSSFDAGGTLTYACNGASGGTGYTEVTATGSPGARFLQISCPSGQKVVGGGGFASGLSGSGADSVVMTASFPQSDHSWFVSFDGTAWINNFTQVNGFATCVNP